MESTQPARPAGGRFLGFPLAGFGFFTSLLLAVASAFFAFFASTALAIFALLAWNLGGHHTVNYAASYLYVGFPVGVAVLAIAIPVFAVLWIRANVRS